MKWTFEQKLAWPKILDMDSSEEATNFLFLDEISAATS